MTISEFIQKVNTTPTTLQFSEIITLIDENYDFSPTGFKNGELTNEAGQNSGSCKLFSFAKMQNLSQNETLACFGDYYRQDVLENPNGTDH